MYNGYWGKAVKAHLFLAPSCKWVVATPLPHLSCPDMLWGDLCLYSPKLQVCEGSHSTVSCDLLVTALTKFKKNIFWWVNQVCYSLYLHASILIGHLTSKQARAPVCTHGGY